MTVAVITAEMQDFNGRGQNIGCSSQSDVTLPRRGASRRAPPEVCPPRRHPRNGRGRAQASTPFLPEPERWQAFLAPRSCLAVDELRRQRRRLASPIHRCWDARFRSRRRLMALGQQWRADLTNGHALTHSTLCQRAVHFDRSALARSRAAVGVRAMVVTA
jgi:hypothetical protein